MEDDNMKNKRRTRSQRNEDPNVAFYLDEQGEDFDIEDVEYDEEEAVERVVLRRRKSTMNDYDEVEQRQHKKKKPAKKRKKKRSRAKIIVNSVLIIFLLLQIPMLYGIFSSFEWRTFSSPSQYNNTKGILLLGIDNDGEDSIKTGHTDSITYIGANFRTKKAITMPIYRDANIMQTCTGTKDNINRIYANHGISCLVESTASFLELPIDYYALITMDGLIKMVDSLGTVEITPTGSYCSDYGEDGQTYCFENGVTMKMTGPQALAYIRYRGSTSGENRANRQMELIMAIKNSCMSNLALCYIRATPTFTNNVKTNIPITQLLNIVKIFSNDFTMEKLDVIHGDNTINDAGWTQIVDDSDRRQKTAYILETIFRPE